MTARAKTGVDDPAALAPSTAVSYLLALFDYLRLRQIDATELQRSLNVDLNDRDARVSLRIRSPATVFPLVACRHRIHAHRCSRATLNRDRVP